jgi:hypothetical protein
MITGAQIREARKLLAWDRETLARRAKVRCSAIERAEGVSGEPPITIYHATLIRNALQQGGVEFTDCGEPWVKLKAKRAK